MYGINFCELIKCLIEKSLHKFPHTKNKLRIFFRFSNFENVVFLMYLFSIFSHIAVYILYGSSKFVLRNLVYKSVYEREYC